MINIGDLEIAGVYIGDVELSVYAGDELIYPLNFGTLTGISLDNLTWVTDVPASGGTATSANCSYTVTGYYDSGKTRKLNSQSTITGYLDVPETSADTRQMVGTLTLTATCSGFTDTASVDVYQDTMDYSKSYLTFKITTSGNIRWKKYGTVTNKTISYSKNGGSWTSITASSTAGTTFNVSAGDVVRFKGSNSTYGSAYNKWCTFSASTAGFEVEGNIMSLVNGDNFVGTTTISGTYNFTGLFRSCTVTSAKNLVLPSMSLTTYCYGYMFLGCTSLTTAPELPATALANYCYCEMFRNCTSLTKAPSVLPATYLYQYSYYMLFNNCPINYIKCLATSISTSNCTTNWVQGVSSSGTFVKNSNMSSWTTGDNGIPSNWTVENV